MYLYNTCIYNYIYMWHIVSPSRPTAGSFLHKTQSPWFSGQCWSPGWRRWYKTTPTFQKTTPTPSIEEATRPHWVSLDRALWERYRSGLPHTPTLLYTLPCSPPPLPSPIHPSILLFVIHSAYIHHPSIHPSFHKATSNRMLVSCPPPTSTEVGRMECYYWSAIIMRMRTMQKRLKVIG